MASITVKLAADLRSYAGTLDGTRSLQLQEGAAVSLLLERLGIPDSRVKMIMVNGRGATADTPLKGGDRVALFPPELAFNTYVWLYFGKDQADNEGDD